MEINLQTASQQWVAHVLNPGPFITHVLITWEESAYLRYYENGTLVSEVAAMIHEHPGDPYTSLSVFVDLPRLWLHQLKVWDQQLISSHGYDEYATSKLNGFELDIVCNSASYFLNVSVCDLILYYLIPEESINERPMRIVITFYSVNIVEGNRCSLWRKTHHQTHDH